MDVINKRNPLQFKDGETQEALKALLQKATENFSAVKAENEKLNGQIAGLQEKMTEMTEKFATLQEKGDMDAMEELKEKMNDALDQISDLRTKQRENFSAKVPTDQKEALRTVAAKSVVHAIKSGGNLPKGDTKAIFKMFQDQAEIHCKALNITNPSEGGLAVAEILGRDVLDYAREFSMISQDIGTRPGLTRDYRQLIKVSYPSVAAGIENVAGVELAETTTQEYAEVRSKPFKLYMKPRITDEAMMGTDIDIYGDLVRSMGEEQAIYIDAQILYGDGTDDNTARNCRGILSSNRIDITNLTGESFKPTLAPDPADARDSDFYPVYPTGVDGSLGATDEAVVDLIIDIVNAFPTRYLNGSAWRMNRKTKGVLEKVRDSRGLPLLRPAYTESGMQMQLNGYPVVIDDTLPDIASNSYPIIFGRLDWAFAVNPGDIDYMLVDPYSVDGCTVIKTHREFFEIMQRSDAILVVACTVNGPA